MKRYGLIGKTLKHSFSGKFFAEKFEKENITDCRYDLHELPAIADFPKLIEKLSPELKGLNVTIPYKIEVMDYLHSLDDKARRIGAVNVIKIEGEKLTGYNSDYYGFRASLEKWLPRTDLKALILGTGGASNAVRTALEDMNIPYTYVSRSAQPDSYTYEQLQQTPDLIDDYHLIINSTPLGTYPAVEGKPDLPYSRLTSQHNLYDLVYNPEVTAFLQEGIQAGAKTKSGGDMLELQAEKSWEIWNS
jgi:shikimate dehydrogenase